MCIPLCPDRVKGVPNVQRAPGASATGPRRLGGEERSAPRFQGALAAGAQPGGAGRPAQETGASAWCLGSPARRHSGLHRPFPLEKALELCLLSVPAMSCRGCLLSTCVLSRFSPAPCNPMDCSPPGSSVQVSAASAPKGPSRPLAEGAHRAQRLKPHPPLDSSRPALSREAASGCGSPSLGCRQKPPLGAVPPPPLGSQSFRLPRGWGGPPAKPGLLGEAACLLLGGMWWGKQVVPHPQQQGCGFRTH